VRAVLDVCVRPEARRGLVIAFIENGYVLKKIMRRHDAAEVKMHNA
jgi:hypothetical protein